MLTVVVVVDVCHLLTLVVFVVVHVVVSGGQGFAAFGFVFLDPVVLTVV